MLETIILRANLCVVGGGMAGICAAIAAAREQAKAEARAELEAAAGRPTEGATRQTGNSPTDPTKLHGAALDAFLESFLTH